MRRRNVVSQLIFFLLLLLVSPVARAENLNEEEEPSKFWNPDKLFASLTTVGERLLAELEKQGAPIVFHNFKLSTFLDQYANSSVEMRGLGTTGAYMVARHAIKKGDVVLNITEENQLNLYNIVYFLDQDLAAIPEISTLKLFPSEFLVIYLLKQSGNHNCGWRDYIQTVDNIRREPFTVPCFWNNAELHELQASIMREWIVEEVKYSEQRFNELHETLFQKYPAKFPAKHFNKYAWLKFTKYVVSRSFGDDDPSDVTGKKFSMVVYADQFRHEKNGCTAQLDENYNFVVIANRDYSYEEEVGINMGYSDVGGIGNEMTLLQYGTVAKINPNTKVPVTIAISFSSATAHDVLLPIIKNLPFVHKLQNDKYGARIWIAQYFKTPSSELLLLARLLSLSEEEVKNVENVNRILAGHMVGLLHERKSLLRMQKVLVNRLDQYETRAETDQLILDSGHYQYPTRFVLAVKLRLDEKLILLNELEKVDKLLNNLV